jgi:hypothetical protein
LTPEGEKKKKIRKMATREDERKAHERIRNTVENGFAGGRFRSLPACRTPGSSLI